MNNHSIEARDIFFRYGKKKVLLGASFGADPGECIGIAGINGSGKSTLLSLLAGVRRAKSGSFICFGKDLWKDRRAASSLVGYLPQTNPLMEELTVADNLRLWSGRTIDRTDDLLLALELDDLLYERVNKLSGGMKRRAAIAASLAGDPPVLIMDEPTTSLDLYHKTCIHRFIRDYNRRNGTVILSTHDPAELGICSRLYYLAQGVLREETLGEVIQDLQEEKK